ncbi:DMT family transporter [Phreatobacter cathodiphilus]|uniref:EamA family transporter n=1 Tax=Phreatobacter cathodiphilus TaxID=1868589 RepID=A0A2S0NGN2_9HYPH|nr:DMT family transporter [Phreatobacter cathodiphilus]AVO47315.1 EamA family transporter [Phreatobacter cathodiphilus]
MSGRPAPSRPATLAGFGAIGLWGLLALFTAASGTVPPFQLTAMTFAIGGGIGLAVVATRPGGLSLLAQPPRVWLHGIAGLFGYHALYFTALRYAPAAEANLLNYLWPLLIVVFSALLPGERLKAHHVLGALLGLAGTVLLIASRGGLGAGFAAGHLVGYAAALGCALVWSVYSVTARLLPNVPTEAVAGFCLMTAVLALLCHLALETTVWPAAVTEWLAILALGLGPVGAAFYLWDRGMKLGDIQVLGAASYAAPVISTLALVAFGHAQASLVLGVSVALIVAGSVVAAKEMFRR